MRTIISALLIISFISAPVMGDTLRPQTPEEVHKYWTQAFNDKNIDQLCSLYAKDAAMKGPDGSDIRGKHGICESLKGFLDVAESMELKTVYVMEGGNTALLRSEYTYVTVSADGEKRRHFGQGIEVAQKQPDGSWLFILDHPSGGQ